MSFLAPMILLVTIGVFVWRLMSLWKFLGNYLGRRQDPLRPTLGQVTTL
jgi:hypothetical protein